MANIKILPDWTFDDLIELFDDLTIDYEITKRKNSNGNIMNVIVYWDYNENKICLCFDETSGKFIYKINDISSNDIELAEDIRNYNRSIKKSWSDGSGYYYDSEEECRKYGC